MAFQALLFCPDDKTARTLTQVLGELEFSVEACTEPFAAVKKLMGQHFDALVVDCDNEQNATLLFKSARNSTSNQASLAVAIVEGQAGVAKAFRIGANLVLTKPINVEQSKGTLRVARGLLRKGEPGKPAAQATTVPEAAPAAATPPAAACTCAALEARPHQTSSPRETSGHGCARRHGRYAPGAACGAQTSDQCRRGPGSGEFGLGSAERNRRCCPHLGRGSGESTRDTACGQQDSSASITRAEAAGGPDSCFCDSACLRRCAGRSCGQLWRRNRQRSRSGTRNSGCPCSRSNSAKPSPQGRGTLREACGARAEHEARFDHRFGSRI